MKRFTLIFREKASSGKGQEVEFSGIDEIESILSPDYFEYVSENKARFKGETADYSVLYDPANELLYIEKAGATYPDGLWFCGANWGHPQARLVTTSGWSMDGPNNVLYCYKSADNVFQLTLYLANNFSFKFSSIEAGERETMRSLLFPKIISL